MCWGHVHGLVEAAEMAGADGARSDQRCELELDLGREGERALRPDQDVRQVEIVAARHQRVEVIAADPPLDLREPGLDLLRLRGREPEQALRQGMQRRGHRDIGQVARDRPEMGPAAVGQNRIDRLHVLARVAVAERAGAAGIVAHHAADGGARSGRDVDRKPQPMGLELPVELVEHDAGLDHAAGVGDIERDHMIEIFRAVDDERFVNRLSGLRSSAAARQHRDTLLSRQTNGALRLRDRARQNDAHRHDLVVRGVGRIAAAGEAIEPHLPGELRREPPFEPGQYGRGHGAIPIHSKNPALRPAGRARSSA